MESHDECPVCLDPILPTSKVGTVIPCNHIYHDPCIQTWSMHSNSCPTCRRSYYQIKYSVMATPMMVTRIQTVQDRLAFNPAIDNIPTEFVQRPNHLSETLNTTLSDQASNVNASNSSRSVGICSICSLSQLWPSRRMVSCINCGSGFHMTCLGAAAVVADSWFCPICDCAHEIDPFHRPVAPRRRRSPEVLLERPLRVVGINGILPAPSDIDDLVLLSGRSVLNGGVLLRREERQRQHLTREEELSWKLFESVRAAGDSESSEVDDSQQLQSVSEVRTTATTTTVPRRKRRRRTEVALETSRESRNEGIDECVNESLDDGMGDNRNITNNRESMITDEVISVYGINRADPSSISGSFQSIQSNENRAADLLEAGSSDRNPISVTDVVKNPRPSSRISSLIRQIKSGGLNHSEWRSDVSTAIGPLISHSPVGSNEGGSPMFSANSASASDTEYSEEDTKRISNELTLEHKKRIQAILRHHLRPLYRPHDSSPDKKIIKSEAEYVTINKGISRRIYAQILQKGDPDDIFIEELQLTKLIDDEAVSYLMAKGLLEHRVETL